MTPREQHTTRKAAAGLIAVAGLVLAGCGGTDTEVEDITEDGVAESAPAAEGDPSVPPGPYLGGYTRTFVDDREVYAGQDVTLTAEVEEVLSPSALTIGDPDDADLEPLLVLHELDLPDLEPGRSVEVTGMVQEDFDVAVAEEQLGADLEDALFEEHAGDPWLLASDATVTPEG